MPAWMTSMADAIDERLGEPATRVTTTVFPIAGVGTPLVALSAASGNASQTSHGEVVVLLNWAAAAQGGVPVGWADYSTVEVVNAVMPELTKSSLIPGLTRGIYELPIHLIGHSRGGSLVAELARRFAASGIWVDQVTTLDPRPRDSISGDAEMGTTPWPVTFADNYYQDWDWNFVDGEPVSGAADRYLPYMDNGYAGRDFSNHSNVHLWYHGTIDTTGDAPDGPATLLLDSDRDSWYASGELRGANAGFGYSRIGGLSRTSDTSPAGDAPILGLHPLRGGSASRELTDVSQAVWPNVVAGGVSGAADGILSAGDNAELTIRYWDADSSITIEAYLDTDTNPYNGYSPALLASLTGPATPGRTTNDLSASINAAALQTGQFYVMLFATDAAGRRRVLPSLTSIAVEAAPPAPLAPRVAAAFDVADPSKIDVRLRSSDDSLRAYRRSGPGPWAAKPMNPSWSLPPLAGDPQHWRRAGGAAFTAYVSNGDLILLDEADDATGPRNLTSELQLESSLLPELDLLDAPDGIIRLVARSSEGDIIVIASTDGSLWSATNITTDHLRANARATPALAGALVTYATLWGGLNIAGLTAEGTLWSIWTSPDAGGWFSSDLSVTAGTPTLAGGLAPYVTPWGGINIAGVEPSGALTVTWWAPGLGGEWRRADFSEIYGKVDLLPDTIVSYVTPWNALNVAGVDPDGRLWVYWWEPSRAGDPELDRWTLSRIDPHVPVGGEADLRASGPITPLSTPAGRIDLFSSNASGDPVRLWWDRAVGDYWNAELIEG